MQTDAYTKFLLTLITLFLGILCADKVYNSMVPEAFAGGDISSAIGTCPGSARQCVNVATYSR